MTTIKCKDCEKLKPQQAFSNSQINTFNSLKAKNKNNKTFNPVTTGYIRCRECGSQQVTELQCNWCDKWKARNNFSGDEARKGNGVAICSGCVEARRTEEPGGGSEDDDGDGSEREFSDEEDEDPVSKLGSNSGTA